MKSITKARDGGSLKFNEALNQIMSDDNDKLIFLKKIENCRVNNCITNNDDDTVIKTDSSTRHKYIALSHVFSKKRKKKPEEYFISQKSYFLWEQKYEEKNFNHLFLNPEIINFLDKSPQTDICGKPKHLLLIAPSGCGLTSIITSFCQEKQIKLISYQSISSSSSEDFSKLIPKPDQQIMQQHAFRKSNRQLLGKSIEYLTESLFFDDIHTSLNDDLFFLNLNKTLNNSLSTVFISTNDPLVQNKISVNNTLTLNLYNLNIFDSQKTIFKLRSIFLMEGYMVSASLVSDLLTNFNFNIKKLLNFLQFWLHSNFRCSFPPVSTVDELKSIDCNIINIDDDPPANNHHSIDIGNIKYYAIQNSIDDFCNPNDLYIKVQTEGHLFINSVEFPLWFNCAILFFKYKISFKALSQTLENLSIRSHSNWRNLTLDYYPYISLITKLDSQSPTNNRRAKKYTYLQRNSFEFSPNEMNDIIKYY